MCVEEHQVPALWQIFSDWGYMNVLQRFHPFQMLNRNHVLPSWFIQQVLSNATPQAWILQIDSTFFARVVTPVVCPLAAEDYLAAY